MIVDRSISLKRLRNEADQSRKALKWVSSYFYFTYRVFRVTAVNFISSADLIRCGVPQSSVLGLV